MNMRGNNVYCIFVDNRFNNISILFKQSWCFNYVSHAYINILTNKSIEIVLIKTGQYIVYDCDNVVFGVCPVCSTNCN